MPASSGPDLVPLLGGSVVGDMVLTGKTYDLSHELRPGMPVYGPHPPYSISMYRRHGDPHPAKRAGGSSFANEQIVTSTHVATHIDALGHFSRDGLLHGGCPADAAESVHGLSSGDAAEIGPLIRRGVLLDVAAARGVDHLQGGDAITGDELDDIAAGTTSGVRPGDIVLIRTGWAQLWDDAARFNNAGAGWPGPDDSGAHWLVGRGVVAAGSDTPAFEAIPTPGDSVHAILLVDAGVYIIENLNLEELAGAGISEFLFIALPLPIVGATGSPVRPLAIV
jgi:kynurenine formamidase